MQEYTYQVVPKQAETMRDAEYKREKEEERIDAILFKHLNEEQVEDVWAYYGEALIGKSEKELEKIIGEFR